MSATDPPDTAPSAHDGHVGGPQSQAGLPQGGQQMLPLFPRIAGVPEGLEPLVGIEAIYVHQQLEIIEILIGFESQNRYEIMNNYGQRIFFAGEKSACCDRQFCGSSRPFVIYLYDFLGRAAVTMERECNWSLRWWGASVAGTNIVVKSGFTGELYGTVVQQCSCVTPSFDVLDAGGNRIMRIDGPGCGTCCPCLMCCDAEFPIFLNQGSQGQAGVIMKKFGMQEIISDANSFGIRFNPNLEPQIKAVLMGATFAIDYSFFESGGGSSGVAGAIGGSPGQSSRGPCTICNCLIFLFIFIIVLGTAFILINAKK